MATKELTIFNSDPFQLCGKVVYGERFVGRKSIISKIRNTIVKGSANVSLIGLPRMGKSSIAYQAIMADKESLIQDNILPVFYTLTTNMDISAFYIGLLRLILKEFKGTNLLKQKDIDSLTAHYEEYRTTREIYEVQDFMDDICSAKIKLIIILDEFDAAPQIFQTSGGFEELRTLCYEGERSTFISFLTTSRRSIQNIETICGNSTFYHLFASGEIPVGAFNSEDIDLYWKRIRKHIKRSYAPKLTKDVINVINVYSGAQPFLLDLVNKEFLADVLSHGRIPGSLDEVRIKFEEQFKYFEKIIDSEGLLEDATEVLLGPVTSQTVKSSVDRLSRYSFIQEVSSDYKKSILHEDMGYINSKKNVYICISAEFMRYFYQTHKYDKNRLLPLYGELLKVLKDLIVRYFIDNYGANWESNTTSQNILELRNMRNLDRIAHITQSPNLSYYINETIIKKLIKEDPCPFKSVFKSSFGTCKDKLIWICNIRNHYAHDNSDYLSAEEVKKAQDYCEEIYKQISDWNIKPTSLKSSYPK